MIKIGILGDIGSGKSYVANSFGYPVFNADKEVSRLYKTDKKTYYKLKKILPNFFQKFPIEKNQILNAILEKKQNLKKIENIVHKEVRKKLDIFLKKNQKKKIVILDIPLFIENKIFKKNDILIFVHSKKKDINERIKKRANYNVNLINMFRKIQLNLSYKKKKSHFIIKNTFTKIPVKNSIRKILNEIL